MGSREDLGNKMHAKLFRTTLCLDWQSRALEFSKQRTLHIIRLRVQKIREARGIVKSLPVLLVQLNMFLRR